MPMQYQKNISKQQGSALLIMLMILVAMTILTFMATNIGKTDARISGAYADHARAFINAEEMLARLRYALGQMPLPEGVAVNGVATNTHPIWKTGNMQLSKDFTLKDGEPDYTDPNFAESKGDNWETGTLTCKQIEDWMKNTALKSAVLTGKKDKSGKAKTYFDPIDCSQLDPENKTRTVIELISRKKNEGDIADARDTYFYRITIRAKGDRSGEALAQGITGIQYN